MNNFYKDRSSKDGYSHRCKDCSKKLRKKYYNNNKQYYINYATNSANKRKKLLYQYLLKHPCVICGESDPVCLEFDHLFDKEVNISWAIGKWCWERVLKEISKCQILCANCHKKKTSKQQNWYVKVR